MPGYREMMTGLLVAAPFAAVVIAVSGHHDFLQSPPPPADRVADVEMPRGDVAGPPSVGVMPSELRAEVLPIGPVPPPSSTSTTAFLTSERSATRIVITAAPGARGVGTRVAAAARLADEPSTRWSAETRSRWLDLDP